MLKKQRLLFLPGFGEDERIFRNIIRYFGAYDVEVLDYRTVLPVFSEKSIQLQSFIRSLINNYTISQNDILIGHSLGGFIAHHIRQEIGCPICLHSSFTDPAKIKVLLRNKFVAETAIQNGFFTSFAFRKGARLLYALKDSKEEMECVLDTLSSYGEENILKLVLLFFNRKKRLLNWLRSSPSYDYAPNLILHPKKDNIISAPDEDYILIPGDHFSIATYPQKSVFIILDWLKELQQQSKIQSHHFHNEISSFKVAG
jgi:hypothetical protein